MDRSYRMQYMADQETMNNDVIEQILLRLPASSLLRYQLVCKTWRDIIEKPEFKKEHAELHNKRNDPFRLLVLKIGVHSEVYCEKDTVNGGVDLTPLWMPRRLGSDVHFVGCCNGLVCTEVKGKITVFNPVTREVRCLPNPTRIKGYGSNKNERMKADFFFHSATGEYKVVLFHQHQFNRPSCSVNMYTLGANSSWRVVGYLRGFPFNHGVNVEDTIYWHFCLSEDNVGDIISLNLRTERINFINSPIGDAMLAGLTKWHDGKLCGISYHQEHATMNFWTLGYYSAEAGMIYTVRYRCLLKANAAVRFLLPYSIKMNIIYFVHLNITVGCRDISTNSLSTFNYTCGLFICEIMNCFAYVETLLAVPPA